MAKKHSFDYFEAFVKAVDSSCAAASLLNDTLRNFDPDRLEESMTAMHKIEHAADGDKHRMMKVLIREFLPPIEREDVTELTQKIDDVTDALEDVLVKIYTFNIRTIRPEALEFMDIIVACCCSLKKAVQEFRNFKKSGLLSDCIIEVNDLEARETCFIPARCATCTSIRPTRSKSWYGPKPSTILRAAATHARKWRIFLRSSS